MRPKLVAAVVACLVAANVAAETTPHFQSDFPPEEFKDRWAGVFAAMAEKSVAIVQGAPLSNGFIFPRQSNEFYYLSGIETPGSYVLLDARVKTVTLYLPPRNERLERSEGKVLNAGDAEKVRALTGADRVLSTETMAGDWLASLPPGAPAVIYTPFTPDEGQGQSRHELQAANAAIAADPWDGRESREARLVALLKTRYPRADVKDLTPILDSLRSVKSPREIALIRRASQIAGHGLIQAIRSTRPGAHEYELDAAARYVFLVHGARLEAYRSITASGVDNINNAHYYRNTRKLEDGDLVLMDYAPDYRYYVSDIGRMWPVNGKYSPVQRELLQFVLAYRSAILERIRPGVTAQQIHDEAKTAMAPLLAKTRFSKPVYEEAARKLVETGGGAFSHPVGLAVHDDGAYNAGPLKPGHVFSVDPQLWVPSENLYIRYEDTVVVTEKGVENFTDFLPSELVDLEALVGKGGIVQSHPARR
jgi:Xaa-Pro aminopeptidase